MEIEEIENWLTNKNVSHKKGILGKICPVRNQCIYIIDIDSPETGKLTLSMLGSVTEKWTIYDELYNQVYRLISGETYDS